jgi:hypothetical protein
MGGVAVFQIMEIGMEVFCLQNWRHPAAPTPPYDKVPPLILSFAFAPHRAAPTLHTKNSHHIKNDIINIITFFLSHKKIPIKLNIIIKHLSLLLFLHCPRVS